MIKNGNETIYTSLTNGGPISVHVTDGKITSITPLEIPKEDYPEPWVIDAGGKKYSPPKRITPSLFIYAEKNRYYSKDRVLYPMKRVDWDPNGERNQQNRGISGYERISWDEAIKLVAGEIRRITENYGGWAITGCTSSHHNWGNVNYKMGPFWRFMHLLNYTPVYDNPDSWEGWMWGAAHMLGNYGLLGNTDQTDMLVDGLQHCEFLVGWANDPDSTGSVYNGKSSDIWRIWLRDKGVEFVCIDPHYNATHSVLDSTWYPVRPGSDSALAMAIAHTWIKEGTYDKEYVADRVYGFEPFVKMIMGEDGSFEKTPEWAAEETGIPARRIRALARHWASKKTMLAAGCHGGFGGACRTADGAEWTRLMVCLISMQGYGKPGIGLWGTACGAPISRKWFPGYADPENVAWQGFSKEFFPALNPTKQRLYRPDIPDALMKGEHEFWGNGFCGNSLEEQFNLNKYPIEGKIRMHYRYGSSFMGTMTETNKWVKMYQSDALETVVMQDCWEGSELKYADIILPAATGLEREDIGEWAHCGGYLGPNTFTNWRVIVHQEKCLEPMGESKSDFDIFSLLARELGFEDRFNEGKTITEWCKLNFEMSDIYKEGMCTWEQLCEKGYYIVPNEPDMEYKVAMRWYAEGRDRDTPNRYIREPDPERPWALYTPTGKIEFESESLKHFENDILHGKDPGRPPVPHWKPSFDGYKSENWKKYPLQIISPHPRYSFHTMYDKHASWTDEIKDHRVIKDGYAYWVARINPVDAAERNIGHGDLMQLYNDRGSVIVVAIVTNRVPRGVMHSYCSCIKYDPLVPAPGAPDKGGCINLMTSSELNTQYASGFTPNSLCVEAKKWED